MAERGRHGATDVLWVVEHVARELDVACLIRHLAGRQGVLVEITSTLSDPGQLPATCNPAVVVMPIFYGAGENPERHYVERWPRATFVSLCWEQVFSPASSSYKRLRDDFARERVVHQTWGSTFSRQLLEQGVPPENVFQNGHPAYKLFDAPYRHYFPSRQSLARRHGLDPDRRWVLFTDNYGWAFRPEQDFEKLVQLGGQREMIERLRTFHERSFSLVMPWCRDAAAEDGLELILRPRPATARAVMKARLESAIGPLPSHLRIIKDGSVREWILASDVVVSSYSTTLIEAAIAEKPAFMAAPEPAPSDLQCQWYELVTTVENEVAFLEICAGAVSDDPSRRLREWGRRTFLEGRDPIERLSQELVAMAATATRERGRPAREPRRARALGWKAYHTWSGVRRRVLQLVKPHAAHDSQEADRFDQAEVEARTRAWRVLLDGAGAGTR